MVSQLLPAPGHPSGLPWARCGLALASGVVRRVPFSPNRLGSARRSCCEAAPLPRVKPLLGHDVAGVGVDSGARRPCV